ncbi:MAG: hypothetical protein ACJA0Q_000962 [Saprospiraceae bacterium]|jgi:hypothetical protein
MKTHFASISLMMILLFTSSCEKEALPDYMVGNWSGTVQTITTDWNNTNDVLSSSGAADVYFTFNTDGSFSQSNSRSWHTSGSWLSSDLNFAFSFGYRDTKVLFDRVIDSTNVQLWLSESVSETSSRDRFGYYQESYEVREFLIFSLTKDTVQ